MAFSAGSSSAVQLALRHPERVSRLVLISPNSPHPEPLSKPPRLLAPILFSQPVFWAMRVLARSRLEGLSGTPAGFVPDERERAALREIVDGPFPVGPRGRGTIYDGYIGNLDTRPAVLDRAWARVRAVPVIAKPVVWVAFFPWLRGLAVWESHWGSPRARRIAVALLALAFIAFWSSVTFGGGGSA